jgi:hypothetical protein
MSAWILWCLVAVGVAQAVLAARAYLLERREGLPRSTPRLAASVAVAVALVGVALFAQLSAGPPAPPSAPTPQPRPRDAQTVAKIEQLEQEIAALDAQLATKTAELEQLEPRPREAAPWTPPQWPLLAGLALVLIGFGALTFGDLQTLIPSRASRRARPAAATPPTPAPSIDGAEPSAEAPEPASLAALSAHAHAGRFQPALAMAARMSVEQLHKLEVLDFLFLRAYCAVMSIAAPRDTPATHQERTEKLALASKDLASLLELAPHSAEARWLAGYTKARAGQWQAALDTMRAARGEGELPAPRSYDHDESVCLLMLAEAKLGAADNQGATQLFDEVTRLGALVAQIPVAMVTHRILTVREHLKSGKLSQAAEGVESIRQIEGLGEAAQRSTAVACDVYGVAIRHRSGELAPALAALQALFTRWLPAQLPEIEDQAADEFLLPAIDKAGLELPADLYRGLFFLEAAVRTELAARRGGALTAEEVEAIAAALLRALQFQPRHRESLAALAGLYLAYRKERTEKALAWMDAAIVMGVRSPRARALLAEARRLERERKELLQLFRSTSARFLSDPAVSSAVRKALLEELARFEEFRPVVIELQHSGALEAPPPGELTVSALRERAAFVGGVAAEVITRSEPAAAGRLGELHLELLALASNVETSATRIAALERQVMEQMGRIVLR